MTPLVSVLLPNLNNRRFLDERVETIFNQTLKDWDLVIIDNHSEDGAWEFFQTLPARDNRVRISQAPKAGLYPNWNNCVRQATGRYVYIATSDDTMPPDCLEKLVDALETNPQCDLAHCKLRLIDEHGHDAPDWWSQHSMFVLSAPALLEQRHLRLAPFDGLLHLSGETVYTSITQLLIRRTLFNRVGLFEARWGSVGDFNWCMRASLVGNTVHVPGTWGGWRVYSGQATAGVRIGSPEHYAQMNEMIEDAVTRSEAAVAAPIRSRLKSWAVQTRELRDFNRGLQSQPRALQRGCFVLSSILSGSKAAVQHLKARANHQESWPENAGTKIQSWLKECGVGPVLVPAPAQARVADTGNQSGTSDRR
jgi:hypothetical protein